MAVITSDCCSVHAGGQIYLVQPPPPLDDHDFAATLYDPSTGGVQGGFTRGRDCHFAAPPSPFGRFFNSDGEGMSVK